MALKLRLKPCERVVINGCVVQNENRRYTLTVSNFAQIIRGSDIMQEDEADTPVRRAYFVIQSMLLDPQAAEQYGSVVAGMMAKLYTAFMHPEMQDRIMQAMRNVSDRDYYKALACLRPVMTYEDGLLNAQRSPRDERTPETCVEA
ncbi:flagellar biosynthesis repressor FlbT [Azospirillum brasilense]|uniref:flagellar biosynthesis repressor FlbT n=1 Tax=Azospirillum brasilense TaxID=192 RepID=UPI000E67F943|nr:flagellar biosynthesis repressor FlbT [Azospirillum brasilense]NUB28724.1 flagellar protein [Azospirillum brasilense]NUB35776.1 flagellar protein [Azospirillum brasilense]RIV96532.1 flagellar protein [Azospirillum brasilense]